MESFDEFRQRIAASAAGARRNPSNGSIDFEAARANLGSRPAFLTGGSLDSSQNTFRSEFLDKVFRQQDAWARRGRGFDWYNDAKLNTIATYNFERNDGSAIRFGDVYEDGEYKGNVYNDFGLDAASADALMARFALSPDEQRRVGSAHNTQAALEEALRRHVAQSSRGVQDAKGAAAHRDEVEAVARRSASTWWDGDEFAYIASHTVGQTLAATPLILAAGPAAPLVAVGAVLNAGVSAALNVDEGRHRWAELVVQNSKAEPGLQQVTNTLKHVGSWAFNDATEGPFSNWLHLAEENLYGRVGDGLDAKRRPDRELGWVVADAASALVSPLPGFALVKGGTTLGKVGTALNSVGGNYLKGSMAVTTGAGIAELLQGEGFDVGRGDFASLYTNEDGGFDLGRTAAALGSVGIDALQLGVYSSLVRTAKGSTKAVEAATAFKQGKALEAGTAVPAGTAARAAGTKQLSPLLERVEEGFLIPKAVREARAAGRDVRVVERAGRRFWVDANDPRKVLAARRTAAGWAAPSEAFQALAASAIARSVATRQAAAKLGSEAARRLTEHDVKMQALFEQSAALVSGRRLRPTLLVNAIGEGYEEAVQEALDSLKFGYSPNAEDVLRAGIHGTGAGGAMGANLYFGSVSGVRADVREAQLLLEELQAREVEASEQLQQLGNAKYVAGLTPESRAELMQELHQRVLESQLMRELLAREHRQMTMDLELSGTSVVVAKLNEALASKLQQNNMGAAVLFAPESPEGASGIGMTARLATEALGTNLENWSALSQAEDTDPAVRVIAAAAAEFSKGQLGRLRAKLRELDAIPIVVKKKGQAQTVTFSAMDLARKENVLKAGGTTSQWLQAVGEVRRLVTEFNSVYDKLRADAGSLRGLTHWADVELQPLLARAVEAGLLTTTDQAEPAVQQYLRMVILHGSQAAVTRQPRDGDNSTQFLPIMLNVELLMQHGNPAAATIPQGMYQGISGDNDGDQVLSASPLPTTVEEAYLQVGAPNGFALGTGAHVAGSSDFNKWAHAQAEGVRRMTRETLEELLPAEYREYLDDDAILELLHGEGVFATPVGFGWRSVLVQGTPPALRKGLKAATARKLNRALSSFRGLLAHPTLLETQITNLFSKDARDPNGHSIQTQPVLEADVRAATAAFLTSVLRGGADVANVAFEKFLGRMRNLWVEHQVASTGAIQHERLVEQYLRTHLATAYNAVARERNRAVALKRKAQQPRKAKAATAATIEDEFSAVPMLRFREGFGPNHIPRAQEVEAFTALDRRTPLRVSGDQRSSPQSGKDSERGGGSTLAGLLAAFLVSRNAEAVEDRGFFQVSDVQRTTLAVLRDVRARLAALELEVARQGAKASVTLAGNHTTMMLGALPAKKLAQHLEDLIESGAIQHSETLAQLQSLKSHLSNGPGLSVVQALFKREFEARRSTALSHYGVEDEATLQRSAPELSNRLSQLEREVKSRLRVSESNETAGLRQSLDLMSALAGEDVLGGEAMAVFARLQSRFHTLRGALDAFTELSGEEMSRLLEVFSNYLARQGGKVSIAEKTLEELHAKVSADSSPNAQLQLFLALMAGGRTGSLSYQWKTTKPVKVSTLSGLRVDAGARTLDTVRKIHQELLAAVKQVEQMLEVETYIPTGLMEAEFVRARQGSFASKLTLALNNDPALLGRVLEVLGPKAIEGIEGYDDAPGRSQLRSPILTSFATENSTHAQVEWVRAHISAALAEGLHRIAAVGVDSLSEQELEGILVLEVRNPVAVATLRRAFEQASLGVQTFDEVVNRVQAILALEASKVGSVADLYDLLNEELWQPGAEPLVPGEMDVNAVVNRDARADSLTGSFDADTLKSLLGSVIGTAPQALPTREAELEFLADIRQQLRQRNVEGLSDFADTLRARLQVEAAPYADGLLNAVGNVARGGLKVKGHEKNSDSTDPRAGRAAVQLAGAPLGSRMLQDYASLEELRENPQLFFQVSRFYDPMTGSYVDNPLKHNIAAARALNMGVTPEQGKKLRRAALEELLELVSVAEADDRVLELLVYAVLPKRENFDQREVRLDFRSMRPEEITERARGSILRSAVLGEVPVFEHSTLAKVLDSNRDVRFRAVQAGDSETSFDLMLSYIGAAVAADASTGRVGNLTPSAVSVMRGTADLVDGLLQWVVSSARAVSTPGTLEDKVREGIRTVLKELSNARTVGYHTNSLQQRVLESARRTTTDPQQQQLLDELQAVGFGQESLERLEPLYEALGEVATNVVAPALDKYRGNKAAPLARAMALFHYLGSQAARKLAQDGLKPAIEFETQLLTDLLRGDLQAAGIPTKNQVAPESYGQMVLDYLRSSFEQLKALQSGLFTQEVRQTLMKELQLLPAVFDPSDVSALLNSVTLLNKARWIANIVEESVSEGEQILDGGVELADLTDDTRFERLVRAIDPTMHGVLELMTRDDFVQALLPVASLSVTDSRTISRVRKQLEKISQTSLAKGGLRTWKGQQAISEDAKRAGNAQTIPNAALMASRLASASLAQTQPAPAQVPTKVLEWILGNNVTPQDGYVPGLHTVTGLKLEVEDSAGGTHTVEYTRKGGWLVDGAPTLLRVRGISYNGSLDTGFQLEYGFDEQLMQTLNAHFSAVGSVSASNPMQLEVVDRAALAEGHTHWLGAFPALAEGFAGTTNTEVTPLAKAMSSANGITSLLQQGGFSSAKGKGLAALQRGALGDLSGLLNESVGGPGARALIEERLDSLAWAKAREVSGSADYQHQLEVARGLRWFYSVTLVLRYYTDEDGPRLAPLSSADGLEDATLFALPVKDLNRLFTPRQVTGTDGHEYLESLLATYGNASVDERMPVGAELIALLEKELPGLKSDFVGSSSLAYGYFGQLRSSANPIYNDQVRAARPFYEKQPSTRKRVARDEAILSKRSLNQEGIPQIDAQYSWYVGASSVPKVLKDVSPGFGVSLKTPSDKSSRAVTWAEIIDRTQDANASSISSEDYIYITETALEQLQAKHEGDPTGFERALREVLIALSKVEAKIVVDLIELDQPLVQKMRGLMDHLPTGRWKPRADNTGVYVFEATTRRRIGDELVGTMFGAVEDTNDETMLVLRVPESVVPFGAEASSYILTPRGYKTPAAVYSRVKHPLPAGDFQVPTVAHLYRLFALLEAETGLEYTGDPVAYAKAISKEDRHRLFGKISEKDLADLLTQIPDDLEGGRVQPGKIAVGKVVFLWDSKENRPAFIRVGYKPVQFPGAEGPTLRVSEDAATPDELTVHAGKIRTFQVEDGELVYSVDTPHAFTTKIHGSRGSAVKVEALQATGDVRESLISVLHQQFDLEYSALTVPVVFISEDHAESKEMLQQSRYSLNDYLHAYGYNFEPVIENMTFLNVDGSKLPEDSELAKEGREAFRIFMRSIKEHLPLGLNGASLESLAAGVLDVQTVRLLDEMLNGTKVSTGPTNRLAYSGLAQVVRAMAQQAQTQGRVLWSTTELRELLHTHHVSLVEGAVLLDMIVAAAGMAYVHDPAGPHYDERIYELLTINPGLTGRRGDANVQVAPRVFGNFMRALLFEEGFYSLTDEQRQELVGAQVELGQYLGGYDDSGARLSLSSMVGNPRPPGRFMTVSRVGDDASTLAEARRRTGSVASSAAPREVVKGLPGKQHIKGGIEAVAKASAKLLGRSTEAASVEDDLRQVARAVVADRPAPTAYSFKQINALVQRDERQWMKPIEFSDEVTAEEQAVYEQRVNSLVQRLGLESYSQVTTRLVHGLIRRAAGQQVLDGTDGAVVHKAKFEAALELVERNVEQFDPLRPMSLVEGFGRPDIPAELAEAIAANAKLLETHHSEIVKAFAAGGIKSRREILEAFFGAMIESASVKRDLSAYSLYHYAMALSSYSRNASTRDVLGLADPFAALNLAGIQYSPELAQMLGGEITEALREANHRLALGDITGEEIAVGVLSQLLQNFRNSAHVQFTARSADGRKVPAGEQAALNSQQARRVRRAAQRNAQVFDVVLQMGFLSSVANPLLAIGAAMEYGYHGLMERMTRAATSDGKLQRDPIRWSDRLALQLEHVRTLDEAQQRELVERHRLRNKHIQEVFNHWVDDASLKQALFSEIVQDIQFEAAGTGRFTRGLAKASNMAAQIQWFRKGMRNDEAVKVMMDHLISVFDSRTSPYDVTLEQLLGELRDNPVALRERYPLLWKQITNKLALAHGTAQSLAVTWARRATGLQRLSESDSYLGQGLYTAIQLPMQFANFMSLGLQRATGTHWIEKALAVAMHQRKTSWMPDWMKSQFGVHSDTLDMSDYITDFDLSHEFIRGGMTLSTFAFAALAVGGMGLFSGEDEETREWRRLLARQRVPWMYDPSKIEYDFRNPGSTLYFEEGSPLAFLGTPFERPDGSVVHLHNPLWVVQVFTLPMRGINLAVETGDFRFVSQGFLDAFMQIPLLNTDAVKAQQELLLDKLQRSEEALASGEPEQQVQGTRWFLEVVAAYEGMIFENAFLNSLYVGSDPWDRDNSRLPDIDSSGELEVDAFGNPLRTDQLQDVVDPVTGEVQHQASLRRGEFERFLYNQSERKFVAANVVGLFNGFKNIRHNQPIVQHSFERLQLTEDDAKNVLMRAFRFYVGDELIFQEGLGRHFLSGVDAMGNEVATMEGKHALVRSLAAGTVDPNSDAIRGISISKGERKEMRKLIQAELMNSALEAGATERQARDYVYNMMEAKNPKHNISLNDLLYRDEGELIPTQTREYFKQLNTYYVVGPDGKPYTTGVSRAFVHGSQGFIPADAMHGTAVDELGNSFHAPSGLNTGMRGLVRVSDVEVPKNTEKLLQEFKDDLFDAMREVEKQRSREAFGDPGAFNPYGGGRGYNSYGGGYGRGLVTPQFEWWSLRSRDHRFTHGVDVDGGYTRRNDIRRERFGGQRGRLKQWQ